MGESILSTRVTPVEHVSGFVSQFAKGKRVNIRAPWMWIMYGNVNEVGDAEWESWKSSLFFLTV